MKTVQITLGVPEQFHELLDVTARLKGISVEEYIIEELVGSLDCALQDPMGFVTGMNVNYDYAYDYSEQVRELAHPEEARS